MPTTRLPPMTKLPKVAITSPALPPLPKISLVEDRFSASRNRVVISSSVGSTESSSALVIISVASRINRDTVIFMISKASSSHVGSGRMMITIIPSTRALTAMSDDFMLCRPSRLLACSFYRRRSECPPQPGKALREFHPPPGRHRRAPLPPACFPQW
ncbi:hypothetical protein SDC9_82082 [bioreactor metagenome]|uniref:Uncharacterized protein n=1 Tax=bioreactor metagenome TaxID=1076179 RepID=A0A644Z4J2_9ZZZZ